MNVAPQIHEDRLLTVGVDPELLATLEARYGQTDVFACESFLSAIALAAREPVQRVLAKVDTASWRLPQAVRALRRANPDARIVLCCEPAFEPLTSQVEADDYLIHPPTGRELDEALRMRATDDGAALQRLPEVPPSPIAIELASLAHVVDGMNEPLGRLLDRLAAMLQQALGAESVVIRTAHAAGHVGPHLEDPVLVESVEPAGEVLGRIMLGPAPGGYQSAHGERLRHYGRLIGTILLAADRQRKWQELALTDELTGLPNRRQLMQTLAELMPRAARERFRVTLLMFDLDNFKHYNDQFGHTVGDELIRELGGVFRKHSRKHDVVTRYGGDEFCVVFWDAEQARVAGSRHPANALQVLQRFRRDLREHTFSSLGHGARGQLTISGGLATFPWDATTPDDLIRRADDALRQAKQAGKDRIYLIGNAAGDLAVE